MQDTDISNYLFNKSMEIEPRGCKQVPKFQRRWPPAHLKSPSTKSKVSKAAIVPAPAFNSSSSSSTSVSVNSHVKDTTLSNHNHNAKSDDSGKEDSSKSDSEFSVFAQVQLGQNSPTLSPASPAAPVSHIGVFQPGHVRSPSVSSTSSSISRHRPEPLPPPAAVFVPARHQFGPSSPGPHSPASPGPYVALQEPNSPRLLPSTPPPLPPRIRRDSPEIRSPQQIKQAPDAPPLPPRREPAASPSSSHGLYAGGGGTMPRLNPTHTSQLHIRRHANHQPQLPVRGLNNGSTK